MKILGDAPRVIYESVMKEYPVMSIDHPFQKDYLEKVSKLTSRIRVKLLVIGDDLLVMDSKVWIDDTYSYYFHIMVHLFQSPF